MLTRRSFIQALAASALAAGVPFMVEAEQKYRMTQREMFEAWHCAIERMVNPPLIAALSDAVIYGTGAVQIGPGGINHVPLEKLSKALVPITATPPPDIKWFKLGRSA